MIRSYLDTTNVELSTSIQFTNEYPEIKLKENNFFPILIVRDEEGKIIPAKIVEHYFYIAAIINQNEITSFRDRIANQKKLVDLHYVPCLSIKQDYYKRFYSKENDGIETQIKMGGLCPNITDFSKYVLSGAYTDRPHKYLALGVYPCALLDRNECAPEYEIYSIQVSMILPQYSFEAEDYENPIKMTANTDQYTIIRPDILGQRKEKFTTVVIEDDDNENIFKQPVEKGRFVNLDQSAHQYTFLIRSTLPGYETYCDTTFCKAYALIYFQAGNKVTKITRKYTKLVDILGEIGGILGLALIAGSVIYKAYEWKEEEYLKGELFGKKKPIKLSKIQQGRGYVKVTVSKPKEEQGKKEDEIVTELIVDSVDGAELLKILNDLKVVGSAFLKECDQRLISIALQNYTQKKLMKSELEKKAKTSQIMFRDKKQKYQSTSQLQALIKDLVKRKAKGEESWESTSRVQLNRLTEPPESFFSQSGPTENDSSFEMQDVSQNNNLAVVLTPKSKYQGKKQRKTLTSQPSFKKVTLMK